MLRGVSEPDTVVCGAHGETRTTFVCRHLRGGVACGFHASADDPDDPWPDAWCDLCEEAVQAEGEWNDTSGAVADIKILCAYCYEAARDRNRHVPALARGGARLVGRARAQLRRKEIDRLLHRAVHEAQALHDASEARWHWGAMAHWDFDGDVGTMTFTDPAAPTLVADVQLVGSYSTQSSTFQWAWETLGDDDPQAKAIARLQVFGEVRGIDRLIVPSWPAEEVDGWEMASLAAYLLGADGLYSAPFDHLRWFMLLRNWRVVS